MDGAFKLGIVAAVATLAQAVLTLPAFGGDAINFGAFVIVVYDLFFVQQAHAVKAENKDRYKRSLLITPAARQLKRPIAHLRGRPFTFAQIKPTKINLSLFGRLLAVAVLGDDEVDIGLERFQVCQALFVGRRVR